MPTGGTDRTVAAAAVSTVLVSVTKETVTARVTPGMKDPGATEVSFPFSFAMNKAKPNEK